MQLNYRRIGQGKPLVLIHGLGSQWQVWGPVLARLAAERDVVALDLPGFGASPPPPAGTAPGLASLTRLVSEFLDELGLDRPHVAGNSLGGWISLELAKQGRVASATALSPAGFHTDGEAVYQKVFLRATAGLCRLMAPRAETFVCTRGGRTAVFAGVLARPAQIPPSDAADAIRALAGAYWFDDTLRTFGPDRFHDGELIRVPVTIAWGQHDRLLLPRQAARAAAEIPGARSITLYGCGHVPTYDDPERVARVLLDGSS